MKKIILTVDGMTCSACSNGLEKYLNKSFLRKQNDNVKPEDIKAEIILSGINSPSTLQKQLTRIYPYNTSKPNFTRIHSSWNTLYTITHNPYEKFHISIHVPTQNKQKQKIFKQDKAA